MTSAILRGMLNVGNSYARVEERGASEKTRREPLFYKGMRFVGLKFWLSVISIVAVGYCYAQDYVLTEAKSSYSHWLEADAADPLIGNTYTITIPEGKFAEVWLTVTSLEHTHAETYFGAVYRNGAKIGTTKDTYAVGSSRMMDSTSSAVTYRIEAKVTAGSYRGPPQRDQFGNLIRFPIKYSDYSCTISYTIEAKYYGKVQPTPESGNTKVNVTFDANGGAVSPASKSYTVGKTYGSFPTASKSGSTFDGWWTSASGGTKVTTSSTVSTSITRLYAHWKTEPKTYKVIYNGNGSTSGSMSSDTFTSGVTTALKKNAYTRSGYSFLGWSTSSTASSASYSDGYLLSLSRTSDLTLYAVWKKNPVKVTVSFYALDADGGSPADRTFTEGETYGILPNLSRKGYVFDGWYDGLSSYATKITSSTLVSTSVKTLFAHWTANTYKVHFDGNGATAGTMADFGLTYDQSIPLPTCGFSRIGYSFAGWANEYGGEIAFDDGGLVSNLTSVQGKEVMLYAVWNQEEPLLVVEDLKLVGDSVCSFGTYSTKVWQSSRWGYEYMNYYVESGWHNMHATCKVSNKGKGFSSEVSLNLKGDLRYNVSKSIPPAGGKYANFAVKALAPGEEVVVSVPLNRVVVNGGVDEYVFWVKIPGKENRVYDEADCQFMVTLYDEKMSPVVSQFDCEVKSAQTEMHDLYAPAFLSGTLYNPNSSEVDFDGAQHVARHEIATFPRFSGSCSVELYKTGIWGLSDTYSEKICLTVLDADGRVEEAFELIPGKQYDRKEILFQRGMKKTFVVEFVSSRTVATAGWAGYAILLGLNEEHVIEAPNGPVGLEFPVAFDANGGVVDLMEKNYTSGLPFGELPSAYREGYDFNGWYYDGSDILGSSVYLDRLVSASTIAFAYVSHLKARWSKREYFVEFRAAGGVKAGSAASATYDEEMTLPESTVGRNGYTLLGWARTPGGPVEFRDGDTVKNLTTGDSVSLYAVWGANKYSVYFSGNGENVIGYMPEQEFEYDKPQALSPNEFSRDGYDFAGWMADSDGEVVFEDGATVSNLTAVAGDVIVLYAKWKPRSFVVSFEPCEGEGVMDDQIYSVESTDILPRCTFICKGCRFKGWTTWLGGSVEFEDGAAVRDIGYGDAYVSNVVRLYAVWERDESFVDLQEHYGPFIPGVAYTCDFSDVVPSSCNVSGLPSGMKWDAELCAVTGAATKPGVYNVMFSYLEMVDGKSERHEGVARFEVGTLPELTVVTVGEGTGKVTCFGPYLANKKITLKATADAKDDAAKGFKKSVFAGWYENADCTEPVAGAVDYRTASFPYVTKDVDETVYAKFVTVAEDAAKLSVANIAEGDAFTVNDDWQKKIEVNSYSLPSVSVKGLPSGLKFDAKALTISGKPTKPGTYAVELSLKNASVKTAKKHTFKIIVPNLESGRITGGVSYKSDAYTYVAGTQVAPIIPALEDGWTLKASGLPSGLKLTVGKNGAPYAIEGTPTAKPGSYTVTLNLTKGKEKEVATITINIENRTLTLVVADCEGSHTNGCKVSGGGSCAAGKKVTLKATATAYKKATAKTPEQLATVFAGWYRDSGCRVPLEGVTDFRTTSYAYVTKAEDETIYAKFVPATADTMIKLTVNGEDVVDDSGDVRVVVKDTATLPAIELMSVSIPKVSAKGLPAGMKWDGKANRFTGAPTKPGIYKVSVSLTNTTVKKAIVRAFTVEVPNFVSPAFPGLKPESDAYPMSVGVSSLPNVDAGLAPEFADYTIKVSGLPSGLSFKNGVLAGLAKKAGDYTVTFTATKGKDKQVSTITLHVEALPDWTVGTFVGLVRQIDRDEGGAIIEDEDGRYDWYDVLTTVSVTSAGKVSGKMHFESGTEISFKYDSISERTDGGYLIRGRLTARGIAAEVELLLHKVWLESTGVGGVGVVDVMIQQTQRQEGKVWVDCEQSTFLTDEDMPLRQNVWTSKTLPLPPNINGDKETVTVGDDVYTLAFGKNGSVKVSLAKVTTPTKAYATGTATLSILRHEPEVWHCELCVRLVVKKNDYGVTCVFDVTISADGIVTCIPR